MSKEDDAAFSTPLTGGMERGQNVHNFQKATTRSGWKA